MSKHREKAVKYYGHFSYMSIAVLEREGILVKTSPNSNKYLVEIL